MNLYKDIIVSALEKGDVTLMSKNGETNIAQIVEATCYKTLQKIKTVIEDDSLNDAECFMRIEEIMCAFEEVGSHCKRRHDF